MERGVGWMNESAVRLEEQIISLFSEWETEICQGWILKKWEGIFWFIHYMVIVLR